ncbi:MAG: inositol monophosphatase family protein [Candidatus Hydrogenedentota bacterium]
MAKRDSKKSTEEKKKPADAAKKPTATAKPGKQTPAKSKRADKPKAAAGKDADAQASAKRSTPPPSVRSGGRPRTASKVLPRKFLIELAETIKDAVAPLVKQGKGRDVVSTAASGDATFELDKVAEKALLNFLKRSKASVAYYSEDAGYSTFSTAQPDYLLLVDPIDGSRAARCGFEGCVVAVASTRVIERPTMADVDNACVMEVMHDRAFYAERGKGARIYVGNSNRKPKLSENHDLETMSWTMTVPARPAELVFQTAAKLIDVSSLKGGFFACNSTSFSLTRLLTNQLDACVDFASRYMRDIPELVRDQYINAGRGHVLGICPYDMAAALLIAEEAGCVVTDAYGERFDDVLLLDSSENNHQSLVAAANPALHERLMRFLDTRIEQVEQVITRNEARKKPR